MTLPADDDSCKGYGVKIGSWVVHVFQPIWTSSAESVLVLARLWSQLSPWSTAMIFVACTLTQKGKRKQAERRASAKCMQSPAYALHSAPLCFLPSVCVCQETTSSKSVWVIVRSQRRTRWAQLVGALVWRWRTRSPKWRKCANATCSCRMKGLTVIGSKSLSWICSHGLTKEIYM